MQWRACFESGDSACIESGKRAQRQLPLSEKERPGQGMPVLFVDEQLYQEIPDFLIGTVDKFAMMPWRGEAGMLFGRATHLTAMRAYGAMHDAPKGAT